MIVTAVLDLTARLDQGIELMKTYSSKNILNLLVFEHLLIGFNK